MVGQRRESHLEDIQGEIILKKVDVIIPTLRKVHAFSCFDRLHHIPWPYHLHVVTGGKTWAEAINIGLKQTDGKNDVILMDDDVFINESTFSRVEEFYPKSDIFGFKLLFSNNTIQHYGGIVRNGEIGHVGYEMQNDARFSVPLYVCHATTSLVYIKRHVLDRLVGMAEDIPGIQCEDVDFSFRALKNGFQIMVLPNDAIHLQSASKKFTPQFNDKVAVAFEEIKSRHFSDEEFLSRVEEFPIKMLDLEVVS